MSTKDSTCKKCKKGGATPCGYCLTCVNKAMRKYGFENWREHLDKELENE